MNETGKQSEGGAGATAPGQARSQLSELVAKSYSAIIWEQFRGYRLSYYSLLGVWLLFVLATLAPLIALDVPFFISVPESTAVAESLKGVHFPWFRALFDRNLFEGALDIVFNLLLFIAPALTLLVAWRLRNAKAKKLERPLGSWFPRYVFGAGLVLMVSLFVVLTNDSLRQPYVDYHELSRMDGVSMLFPLVDHSYRASDLSSVSLGISADHWLGTDSEGRDVFARLLYGTRISLTIGVVAVALYTLIGIAVGAIAGYFGGTVDLLVLRLIEVMICFPTFFLILTLRGFIDNPSIFHIMLIIGVTGWTGIARLVRGEFLRVRSQDFVQAAISQGLPTVRVIFRHVLPNAMGPVLVAATFGVAGAILIEASLSFLGLGDLSAPSWGQILTSGRNSRQMVLVWAPGLAIFVTVSLLNLVGEGFRDASDPKLRR